jgi:hypothetical protein
MDHTESIQPNSSSPKMHHQGAPQTRPGSASTTGNQCTDHSFEEDQQGMNERSFGATTDCQVLRTKMTWAECAKLA